MSSQFARLKHDLNRAHPTALNQRIEVYANDLHEILQHYVSVSTECALQKVVMRQALECLEDVFGKNKVDVGAINALREALK